MNTAKTLEKLLKAGELYRGYNNYNTIGIMMISENKTLIVTNQRSVKGKKSVYSYAGNKIKFIGYAK